jgi:hypothetical protein
MQRPGSRGGVGAVNPRAKSGYTTLNVTIATKKLLDQLRDQLRASPYSSPVPYDELLHELASDELERRKSAD